LANKKEYKVNPIIQPTHFDLKLWHKDKQILKKVYDYLFEFGTFHFEWGYEWVESHEEFTLLITDGCWADNLAHIAQLLGDFGQGD
jgi:hypothetical protein